MEVGVKCKWEIKILFKSEKYKSVLVLFHSIPGGLLKIIAFSFPSLPSGKLNIKSVLKYFF